MLGVSITRPLSVLQAQGVALAVTTLQDITPITLQALQQSQAPAPNPLLQAAAPNTAQGNPQTGLLQGIVPLPGGRRTTRRELLKLLPLAGGLGCVWVLGTRLKAFSFTSPQALLNELVAPPVSTSTSPEFHFVRLKILSCRDTVHLDWLACHACMAERIQVAIKPSRRRRHSSHVYVTSLSDNLTSVFSFGAGP